MQLWIGIALLAGSWLLGLDYFFYAHSFAWFATVVAGAAALSFAPRNVNEPSAVIGEGAATDRRITFASLALLLPAIWFAAWPYRAAPLLIAIGLATQLLPYSAPILKRIVRGTITAGVILLAQSLALELYAGLTMRSHDLPWPLTDMLAWLVGLLGVDATADGATVAMHSLRQTHRLAATWEMLLDPATLLFFIGGVACLAFRTFQTVAPVLQPSTARWRTLSAAIRGLTIVIAAWLPLRAMLLIGVYLHRVLRSDPDRPLHAMNHFFSPWTLLLLLIPPVLLAWRFVRLQTTTVDEEETVAPNNELSPPNCEASCPSSSWIFPPSPFLLPPCLIALAVALFTVAVYWNPVGGRNQGRVKIVERHSQWSPTTKPYDTNWYVEPRLFDEGSGYNYARVYRYLGQYYEMSRLLDDDKIDDATLADCDVLVIKMPTERYSPDEIKAVSQFVEQGGGLLLIGDHTNFKGSSTAMNDIVRPMGFIFRDDLLFGFGPSPYDQLYKKPAVPHPAIQRLPPLDFAVSCSIAPGFSRGRAVIADTGLWSMPADYHFENYHPIPQYCPEMRYGAFVQAWATWQGRGRVLAFTDSTIFSNFCLGQPGKAELMLGMVEWLNHRSPWLDPRPWLTLLGVLVLAGAIGTSRAAAAAGAPTGLSSSANGGRARQDRVLLSIAAGCFGWTVASLAVAGLHRWSLPEPARKNPQPLVVIDRAFSQVPLSKGAFPQGKENGYGLLEQWIARLDCATVRKAGNEVFFGDVLVSICPSRSVPQEFRDRLAAYVAQGGKLVVIDSPANVNSTANSLLWPFGISFQGNQKRQGRLTTGLKTPSLDIESACETRGGEAVARLGPHPVAAFVRHGKGTVLAIGFASLWNDIRMGETGMTEPDPATRSRYSLLFGLLRPFFAGQALPPPPKADRAADDALLKEIGPAEL